MTGPLMSSKESYAEKRNSLIFFIEDQATNGVYRTQTKESKGIDPITNAEKTVTIVEITSDLKAPNGFARQEESPLNTFKIKSYNLSINSITYDGTVEGQIQAQQKAIMEVQTAIATSKKAEQQALTAEKEGQANAAKAKWEQEVIKAKLVTEAEQKLAVAKLEREAAEQEKQKNILLGEGEAKRRSLVMVADGALEKKLATYENVMVAFAREFGKQKLVPDLQMNSGGSGNNTNAAVDMINLLTTKVAKDLSLELSTAKTAR